MIQTRRVAKFKRARTGSISRRLANIPHNRDWLGITAVIAMAAVLTISVLRAGMISAQEQTLVIEGAITNGTAEGGDVGGLTVSLYQVRVDGREVIDAVTDDDGGFSFDGIEYDSTTGYGISTVYQDVSYGQDLDLSEGAPDPITITVYDASQDDSIISVASASLLLAGVDAETGTISALEIIAVENRSDHAFVPGAEPMLLLRFGLPPGATGLEVDAGIVNMEVAQIDRGFALFANVPPGEFPLMFSYSFPYDGDSASIEKSYRYGAGNVRMLAPIGMMSIASNELGAPSSISLGEQQYNLIEANDFERGAAVTLRMSGLPTNSLGSRVSSEVSGIRFEYAPPVALGAMMAVLLVYAVFWRGRGDRLESAQDTAEETAQEREVVHRMIEELEYRHGSGEIGEGAFRRRVSALNARLARLR